MSDVTGFSELATLAVCEARWAYRYRDAEPQEPGGARYFGTQMHDLCGSWWIGGDVQERAETDLHELTQNGWEDAQRAAWLYDRYKRYYGKDRSNGFVRVVATELQLQRTLPGTDIEIRSTIDQVVQLKGAGLWAVERKTMADWSRLDTLEVDPQVSIYLWQLREAGWPVRGLLYDAIKTYRWVPTQPTQKELKELHPRHIGSETTTDWTERIKLLQALPENQHERPLEDSFRQEWLDRQPHHTEQALNEVYAATKRRRELLSGDHPIRNVGMNCKRCDHKVRCWSELGFAQEYQLASEESLDA